jgi:hypothetical protein
MNPNEKAPVYKPVDIIESYTDATGSGRDMVVKVLEHSSVHGYRVRMIKTQDIEEVEE